MFADVQLTISVSFFQAKISNVLEEFFENGSMVTWVDVHGTEELFGGLPILIIGFVVVSSSNMQIGASLCEASKSCILVVVLVECSCTHP